LKLVHENSSTGWTFPVGPVKRYVNYTAVGVDGHVAVDTMGGVEMNAPGQNTVHETVDVDSDALYPIFVAAVAANYDSWARTSNRCSPSWHPRTDWMPACSPPTFRQTTGGMSADPPHSPRARRPPEPGRRSRSHQCVR